MVESFKKVLENYLDGKKKVDESPEMQQVITKDLPNELRQIINKENYKVKGSLGQGYKADYPWIFIADKNVTTTPMKGLDIVYLFKKDMSGFYLSLNQGLTNFADKFKKNKFVGLEIAANHFKNKIGDCAFSKDDITLGAEDQSDDKGWGYQKGNIISKYYSKDSFTDEELQSDLNQMVEIYERLTPEVIGDQYDSLIDSLLSEYKTSFKGNKDMLDYINAKAESDNMDDPNKHDGTYDLIKKLLSLYESKENLDAANEKDIFVLIRANCIHNSNFDGDKSTKEFLDASLLNDKIDEIKEFVDHLYDEATAENSIYSNSSSGSYGMFSAKHQTNPLKLGANSTFAKDLIELLISLKNIEYSEENENNMLDLVQTFITNNNGKNGSLQTGRFSQMLHSVQPKAFPILNSTGRKVYLELGLELDSSEQFNNYITETKKIKKFRDTLCPGFKNYRVIDLYGSQFLGNHFTDIDFEGITNWLLTWGKKQRSAGQPSGSAPWNEFKKFINYVVGNNPDIELTYAPWQNSGNVLHYFWVRIKDKKYKNSILSLSISIESDGNECNLNVRLEYDNNDVASLSVDDKIEYNKKILQKVDYDKVIYNSYSGSNTNNYDEAYAEILEKNNYRDNEIFKIRPIVYIDGPLINSRDSEILEDTKEAFEKFLPYYYNMFNAQNKKGLITMNKKISLNTILYGPPGTGKTYNSKVYAVAICNYGGDLDKVKTLDYEKDIIPAYNKLVTEGRVTFTTFHQSYGYEEFIEGMKPLLKDDGSKDVYYDVVPGIFKKFCETALTQTDSLEKLGINPNGNIWKILIGKDNPNIKSECFKEDNIRIDFANNPNDSSVKILYEQMKKGDIVVSVESLYKTDGIAIIDDEEAQPDLKDKTEYKRHRSVKWIFNGVSEDFKEINGGVGMTRPTITGMPNINRTLLMDLIRKHLKNDNELKPCVFIIDEINRGNISKIFGELITLIEPSKRSGELEGMSCKLPYSNQPFSVPNNVYILGTMNTADRSIALMDTALRRRFDFVEMMPDIDPIKGLKVKGLKNGDIEIDKMLDAMNKRIEILYDREHTLGHAFFMKLTEANENTVENLASIFKNKIIPLLQEYFYEDYEKIRLVLGDNAKPEANQFIKKVEIKTDVFKGNVSKDDIEKQYRYEINIPKDPNDVDPFMEEDSYKLIY